MIPRLKDTANPLNRAGTKLEQHRSSNQGRDVGVHDSQKRLVIPSLQG